MALNKCGFDKFLKLTPLLKHKYYPLVSYNFIYFLVFILLPENSTVRLIDHCGTDLYMCERNVRLWIWATSEMSDWISCQLSLLCFDTGWYFGCYFLMFWLYFVYHNENVNCYDVDHSRSELRWPQQFVDNRGPTIICSSPQKKK